MRNPIQRYPFQAMGSACEIVVASANNHEYKIQQAINEVQRIEQKYSRYREDSIVSKINHNAGRSPIVCDEETWQMFNFADQLFQMSEGLFDITAGILRQAWNFSSKELPTASHLNHLCRLICWDKCFRREQSFMLPMREMQIDFGGFGKEYAADRAAAILEQSDIKNGYVNLGGDIRFLGPKLDGSSWSIGIQHPRKPDELIASIPLQRGGLATSGDYEKYFETEGKRYCHILNPRTGMPVDYWSSISVVAENSLIAGSYSTIAMLLEEKAIKFLEGTGLSYFAVDKHQQIKFKQQTDT